jgi:lipid II:glycine glycyltransferase (peptidoglycan interpeptide bridge formation enzyme)
VDNLSLKDFYTVNKMSFERQNLKMPYSYDYLKKIDDKLSSENKRKIFFAVDNKDIIHAVLYVIWDDNCSYLLLSGADPMYRDSCAQIYLDWESIKFTKNELNLSHLNFCGSMIKNIAKIWQDFGAVEKPYYSIAKSNSKSHQVITHLNSIKKIALE